MSASFEACCSVLWGCHLSWKIEKCRQPQLKACLWTRLSASDSVWFAPGQLTSLLLRRSLATEPAARQNPVAHLFVPSSLLLEEPRIPDTFCIMSRIQRRLPPPSQSIVDVVAPQKSKPEPVPIPGTPHREVKIG